MKKIFFVGMLCLSLCLLGIFSARAVQGYTLPNAPDYDWWYGSAPTSAGMMMAYYDINGHGGLLYDNLVPGGTAELSTYGNSEALVNNIIASAGHIADFYVGSYGASGDDRISPPPYHSFNSLADFMGTSQDSVANTNGSTTFYYWTNGDKFTAQDAFNNGVWNSDGMYGMLEYLQYAGYGATQIYTELIQTGTLPFGFTFADYMAEIDAGRPVMTQVEGHSMFGYGYGPNNTVYLHDTWSSGQNQMTWGGSYSGMDQWGVVVMELTGGTPSTVPEPTTMLLLGSGLIGLWGARKKFKK